MLCSCIRSLGLSCHGKQNCALTSGRKEINGGHDPCGRDPKYLEVSYRCVVDRFKGRKAEVLACYGEHFSASCPRGKVVRILEANYGRTDRDKCNLIHWKAKGRKQWEHTRCYGKGSREKTAKM